MAYIANNNLLYNAALGAFMAAASAGLAGLGATADVDAEYAALVANAQAFAQAVDSQIPQDSSTGLGPNGAPGAITVNSVGVSGAPITLAASTGGTTTYLYQITKAKMIFDICYASLQGRQPTFPLVQASFLQQAQAIAFVYAQIAAKILTT